MQPYWTLVRRELGSQFVSWAGYVIIAVVMFLLGLCWVSLLKALNAEPTEQPLMEMFYSTMYFWLILLIAAPMVTMRSFALEKYSGTFETLMTTPVSDLQVVMAKFTGALIFYLLMWLPLLGCVFIVHYFSNDAMAFDWRSLGTTALGIVLLGGLFMAVGCFASSLTRSQIIAAVVTFALGISLFLLSFLASAISGQTGWIAKLFTHLSLIEHMRDFTHGVIDTRPIIFYLSLTGLFLFLTWKAVESRRWK